VEVAVRSLSDLVSEDEQARRTELETIKSMFLLPGAPKVSISPGLDSFRLAQQSIYFQNAIHGALRAESTEHRS